MVIVPDSDIILIKSPLKLDNYNQITFSNATDQYNYFMSLPHLEYDGCTYQRKDGVIRFETGDNLRYEDLLGYNYCMYRNDSYSNKWFYAFITSINYVNDGLTTLSIETDVFQTWQFDLVYMNSFIEREHVSDDTIGLHTIPEGLETGNYIINDAGVVSNLLRKDATYICMGVSYTPDNTPFINNDRYYGGIYSGLTYIIFDENESASKFIRAYDKMGRGDAIFTCYMIPSALAPNPTWATASYEDIKNIRFAPLPSTISASTIQDNINLSINSTVNGYTPKNNKLFTFPYNYLSITNNSGSEVTFNYEDFVNNLPSFKLVSIETSNAPTMLIPKNYKKYTESSLHQTGYNFGIPAGKFPCCSWQTDQYTNWLTQNGVNIMGMKIDAPTSQAIGGSIEAILGGVNLGAGGNLEGISEAGSGIGKMFGAVQEQWRHSLQSPTVNGQTSVADLGFSDDRLTYTYYKMSVRYEYAKIIDDFFSMYGYKVNKLATPNIHKRSNWDYIKCIDVNIEGNVPEADLDKIRRLFNNGCTFWHTTSYFLDYSRNNSIL